MNKCRKIVEKESIKCVVSQILPFNDYYFFEFTFLPFCSSMGMISIKQTLNEYFCVSIQFLDDDDDERNHTVKGYVNCFPDTPAKWRISGKTENQSFSLKSSSRKIFFSGHKTSSLHRNNGIIKQKGKNTTLPGDILNINIVFNIFSICDCIKLSTETNNSSNTHVKTKNVKIVTLQEAQSSFEETMSDFSQLSTDLLNFFSLKDFADVDFKIGADTIHAHKFIICARSPVFRKFFENQMHEKMTNTINIEDSKKEDFLLFLRFLYSGALEERDVDKIRALYYLADKYDVKSLQNICQLLLINNLAECNACDILSLADMHSDEILKKAAIQYICKHFKSIQPSEEWKHLVKVSPGLASNIIYSLALKFSALETT